MFFDIFIGLFGDFDYDEWRIKRRAKRIAKLRKKESK